MKNQKERYDVSVIIPTYNRSKLLSYTLDSLLQQSIPSEQFEVIIGDDGSSDDTSEMLKAYTGKMNLKYVFQEDRGYRPASARNKAIRLAEGSICLLVDSSIILKENCLEEHIRFHAESITPRAAVGYVYAIDHNDESEEMLKSLIVPSDPVNSILRLEKMHSYKDIREQLYAKYHYKIEDLPAPWFYFWTCHVSAPTRDLIKIGLFDENFDGRWGVEDNDLGYRLHISGVKIQVLKTARVIHYPHGKDKLDRVTNAYQNAVYFHAKFKTLATELFLANFEAPTDPTALTDLNDQLLAVMREGVVEKTL